VTYIIIIFILLVAMVFADIAVLLNTLSNIHHYTVNILAIHANA